MAELTEEQIQELQTKASKADELEKQLGDMVPKTEVEKAVKAKEEELASQIDPNWQKTRKKMEGMRTALESKGVKVDEEGNVVGNPNNIDINQVRQEAASAARNELNGGELEKILSEYDVESAKLVRHFYGKLTNGEAVNLQNIRGFINQAENAARGTGSQFNKVRNVVNYGGG